LFVWAAMAAAARRGPAAAVAVGLCSLGAFLSKEVAFVTPVLVFLVWRSTVARNRWAPAWPRDQIVALLVAAATVAVLRALALESLLPTTASHERPAGALWLPFKSLLFALSSVYVPLRQISMEPDPQQLHVVRWIAAVAVAVLLWATALRALPERAALWRSLVAGGVSLLLFLNILPQETILSERFLYMASGFLLVPVGAWGAAAWSRSRTTRLVALGAGVLVLTWWMLLSSWRGTVWRTDVTVWRQAVREEPERAAFWDRLGLSLTERRRYNEAEVALTRAVELDPRNPNAQHNMGVLLQSTRRPQDAVSFYQRAIQLLPGHVPSYMNLGQAYLDLRDYPAALEAFQTASQLKPDHLGAHRMVIRAALLSRRLDVARRHLEVALQLAPQDPGLLQMRAKLDRPAPAPRPGRAPEDSLK